MGAVKTAKESHVEVSGHTFPSLLAFDSSVGFCRSEAGQDPFLVPNVVLQSNGGYPRKEICRDDTQTRRVRGGPMREKP